MTINDNPDDFIPDPRLVESRDSICNDPACIKTRQKLEKFRQFVQRVVDAFPCATFSDGDETPVWSPHWLDEAKKLLEADDGN